MTSNHNSHFHLTTFKNLKVTQKLRKHWNWNIQIIHISLFIKTHHGYYLTTCITCLIPFWMLHPLLDGIVLFISSPFGCFIPFWMVIHYSHVISFSNNTLHISSKLMNLNSNNSYFHGLAQGPFINHLNTFIWQTHEQWFQHAFLIKDKSFNVILGHQQ